MACNSSFGNGCSTGTDTCPDKFGCSSSVCPDFTIKRHDTKPPLKVQIEDCDGPMDFTDLVIEANMWAKAKLKTAITINDTYFALADNIGFEQVMMGDIIIMDRARLPEHMLVTGFDETNNLIRVQRGYNGTQISSWKKGASLRIMKIMNATAESEMVFQDIIQIDGTTLTDQLTNSFLVYEWAAKDTCLPGCYWLEFKVLKMVTPLAESPLMVADLVVPSFTDPNLTPEDFGCTLGVGVESVRRFPSNSDGFLIKIHNSPTAE